MKRFKFLSMLLLMLVTTFSFAGCSDDDETSGDLGLALSGNYVGDLSILGLPETDELAYVTLSRLEEKAVSMKIQCEGFDMNMSEVIINIIDKGDGNYLLQSNIYAVEGTCVANSLTFSFRSGGQTYTFAGRKS